MTMRWVRQSLWVVSNDFRDFRGFKWEEGMTRRIRKRQGSLMSGKECLRRGRSGDNQTNCLLAFVNRLGGTGTGAGQRATGSGQRTAGDEFG